MSPTRDSNPPVSVARDRVIGPVKAETRKQLGKKPEPDRNKEPSLTELKARQSRPGSFSDADSQTTDDAEECEGRCDVWGDANPRLTKKERGDDAKSDYAIDGDPLTTAFQD
ncbi:MAG: hypothetical protein GY852_04570 [bacterium]|nr:hypothetical protein [bacterium]